MNNVIVMSYIATGGVGFHVASQLSETEASLEVVQAEQQRLAIITLSLSLMNIKQLFKKPLK